MIASLRASAPSTRGERPWLGALREEAWTRALALGLPSTRDEEWHFTSLRALQAVPFVPPTDAVPDGVEALVAPHRLAHAALELVLVDGRLVASAGRGGAPAGLEVLPLADLLADEAPPAALGAVAPWRDKTFLALNTALVRDGVVLRATGSERPSGPVHLLHVVSGLVGPVATHARVLVEVGPHAQLDVVETVVSVEAVTALANVLVEARVAAGGRLGWSVVGAHGRGTHLVHALWAEVARDAGIRAHAAWLGGAITRSDVHVTLAGPGAEATLDGLYLLDGDAHTDVHTVVDHAAPHTTSQEGYKAVLGGRAHGVFDGRVIVREGSQRIEAAQDCRAMLVSDGAEMSAKPTLEILADDVKCSHGTAVGQLDRTQVAYLRSRGIPAEEAARILTAAFVADRVDRLSDEASRERLAALVEARLGRLQGAA